MSDDRAADMFCKPAATVHRALASCPSAPGAANRLHAGYTRHPVGPIVACAMAPAQAPSEKSSTAACRQTSCHPDCASSGPMHRCSRHNPPHASGDSLPHHGMIAVRAAPAHSPHAPEAAPGKGHSSVAPATWRVAPPDRKTGNLPYHARTCVAWHRTARRHDTDNHTKAWPFPSFRQHLTDPAQSAGSSHPSDDWWGHWPTAGCRNRRFPWAATAWRRRWARPPRH